MKISNTVVNPSHSFSCERFTDHPNRCVLDMCLGTSGRIAISGFQRRPRQVFIDIIQTAHNFTFPLEIIYSNEYEEASGISHPLLVSFLERNNQLISECHGCQLRIVEIASRKQESSVITLDEAAQCMITRGERIYIGLTNLERIYVFNLSLFHQRTINLSGTKYDCLGDLAVVGGDMYDHLFACIVPTGKLHWYTVSDQYPDDVNEQKFELSENTAARSVAVSVKSKVIFVLKENFNEVEVYSLSGCYPLLMTFVADVHLRKIRISDHNHLVVVTLSGQISVYRMTDILTFHNLKVALTKALSPKDCNSLARMFNLKDEFNSKNPSTKSLILALEKKGILYPNNVNKLSNALREQMKHAGNTNGWHILDSYKRAREAPESDTLKAEDSIDSRGGIVEIPGTGVSLEIEKGALQSETLIQMRIISHRDHRLPFTNFSSNSTVVVEILPNDVTLSTPAKLILPHCLCLAEGSVFSATAIESHHQEGCDPIWQENKDTECTLDETSCVLSVRSFSWKTYEINDNIVEAKKIMVFLAQGTSTENIVHFEVGYYPLLPGEKNPGRKGFDVLQEKSFVFCKAGDMPLEVSILKIEPQMWNCDNVKTEIPFSRVAKFDDYSCPFVLHKMGEADSSCRFKVEQGSDYIEFVNVLAGRSRDGKETQTSGDAHQDQNKNLVLTDKQVNKETLLYVCGRITDKWKMVGRHLTLKEETVEQIQSDFAKESTEEASYQMLLCWKKDLGIHATYGKLVAALKNVGRTDLAEEILKQGTSNQDAHYRS